MGLPPNPSRRSSQRRRYCHASGGCPTVDSRQARTVVRKPGLPSLRLSVRNHRRRDRQNPKSGLNSLALGERFTAVDSQIVVVSRYVAPRQPVKLLIDGICRSSLWSPEIAKGRRGSDFSFSDLCDQPLDRLDFGICRSSPTDQAPDRWNLSGNAPVAGTVLGDGTW
ncbi:hypothetical protein V6N12_009715 [Hibiscus sabdariffa]|uniref:Uncharacterized protein n=1 Tax=Hibiscus sabdariffa TaxID=183260 RepID=A0ABR2AHW2_9ROSI